MNLLLKTILLLTALDVIAYLVRLADSSDYDLFAQLLMFAELFLSVVLFIVCLRRRYGRGPVVILSVLAPLSASWW